MDALAIGAAAGGAVGCGELCPGGVDLFQLCQDSLHAFLGDGSRRLYLVLVGLSAVDVDGVSGGIVVHAEVHRPADVPQTNVVAVPDGVGGEGSSLAVDVERLAAGSGGEVVCRLGGGAAQGEAGEDAEPHKDCFPLSAHSNSPFRLLCAFGKQHNTEAPGRSPDYSLEKNNGGNEALYTESIRTVALVSCHLRVDPAKEFLFWHHDPAANLQCRKALSAHQFIGSCAADAKYRRHFRHREHQGQFIVRPVARFLHFAPFSLPMEGFLSCWMRLVSVFDKGIITRHLKNGANLHETATIGETQSGGFFCNMAGVHWGPPCFSYQGGPQQTPAIPPAKSN